MKNVNDDRARSIPLRELLEWLEELADKWVDEEASVSSEAPASICHEPLHQELPSNVVSGKHFISTHFPKRPKLRSLEENHNFRSELQKTHRQPSTSNRKIGLLITAHHKVVSEDCESRYIHRDADVVQNFATQWLQFCACDAKSFKETEKSLQEDFSNRQVRQSHSYWQFHGVWKSLWRIILEPLKNQRFTDPKNFIADKALRGIKEGTSPDSLQSCLDEYTSWAPFWRTTQWANSSFWVDDWVSSDFCKLSSRESSSLVRKFSQDSSKNLCCMRVNLGRRHHGRGHRGAGRFWQKSTHEDSMQGKF